MNVEYGNAGRRAGAENTFRVSASARVDRLRSHCEILHCIPSDLVSAISVTTRLHPGMSAGALAVLSKSLAEEFGLTASVQIRRTSATVRFARRNMDDGRHEPKEWTVPCTSRAASRASLKEDLS
jgi:hypothetical protein